MNGQPGTPWTGSVSSHYENFPVGSWLLPAALRPAVGRLYRFARYADDIADEGDAPPEQRLAELGRMRQALQPATHARHPVVDPLWPDIEQHGLDPGLLLALLSAFEQDVTQHRHADYASLAHYCARSADPVGRLLLQLFQCADETSCRHADSICTALQLINFLQDLRSDWQRGRLYLPLDEVAQAGLSEAQIAQDVERGACRPELARLIGRQADRAQGLLDAGRPLLGQVPRRLRWELRAILAGGQRIIERLRQNACDPLAHRPTLDWRDLPALVRLSFAAPARS